jgi:hypothetical protein
VICILEDCLPVHENVNPSIKIQFIRLGGKSWL